MQGGPGRRVLRAVCLVSGMPHVVTIRELGRGGLLRVAAYDPCTSMTYEASLSKAERACLGFHGEDRKSLMKRLHQRVSLRRANEATGVEGAENRGDSLSTKRTMTLDKTIFSTACRVAAGRIDSRLFRVRAELVDAGRSLALDLYQADTSRQCRMFLTEGDLAAIGLQPCLTNADAVQAAPYAEQAGAMASMITGPIRREIAARRLTRQLRYVPDSESVLISIGGDLRTTAMVASVHEAQRRPQSSLKSPFSQAPGREALYATRHYGLLEGFLKQRHQPRVLMYGDKSARVRLAKNKVTDASHRWAISCSCFLYIESQY